MIQVRTFMCYSIKKDTIVKGESFMISSKEDDVNYPFLNKYSCPVEAIVEVIGGNGKVLFFIIY